MNFVLAFGLGLLLVVGVSGSSLTRSEKIAATILVGIAVGIAGIL